MTQLLFVHANQLWVHWLTLRTNWKCQRFYQLNSRFFHSDSAPDLSGVRRFHSRIFTPFNFTPYLFTPRTFSLPTLSLPTFSLRVHFHSQTFSLPVHFHSQYIFTPKHFHSLYIFIPLHFCSMYISLLRQHRERSTCFVI